MHIVDLRPRFDVVTFDCYGTLIDWEAGMRAAFTEASAADGVQLDPRDVLRVLFDTRPAAEAPEYQTYRDRLTDAAMRVGERLGWSISRERAAFFPESLARWKPFPDTNKALDRLSGAGYVLGILSNVDDDLLAGTLRHFTVSFEFTVTAQQVRSYKPALGHFRAGQERVAGRRWLHAELRPRRGAVRPARHPGGLDQPQGGDGSRETRAGVPRPERAG